jgi:hypothetical protein
MLRPLVTHWGNDPTWETHALAGAPQLVHFPDAVATRQSLVLEELAATGVRVQVAGHVVEFDSDRRLWFCDFRVNAGAVYAPFLRLALARFQPHSLTGVELSRVVLADFVQLLPDRTVTVSAVPDDPNRLTVRVDGLSYDGTSWRPTPFRFVEDDPSTEEEINPAPDLVRVSVEERIASTGADLGWKPVEGRPNVRVEITQKAVAGVSSPSGTPLWLGQVSLPGQRTPGQFRIVVKEFEHLLTDASFIEKKKVEIPDLPRGPIHGQVTESFTVFPGADRLVFAETIEV